MLTGIRFTIATATVALEGTNGTSSLVTVPQGAIIEVTSGATDQGMGTVAVRWKSRTLAMFAIDIEKRGIQVPETASQSARA